MNWGERKIKGLIEINKQSIDAKFPYSEIEYIDTASANEGQLERVQKLRACLEINSKWLEAGKLTVDERG